MDRFLFVQQQIDRLLALGSQVIVAIDGNCTAGKETIGKLLALRDQHNGPEVLIGAGVNSKIITAFRTELPNVRAFHMSGSTSTESGMIFRNPEVAMGSEDDPYGTTATTERKVAATIRELLKS